MQNFGIVQGFFYNVVLFLFAYNAKSTLAGAFGYNLKDTLQKVEICGQIALRCALRNATNEKPPYRLFFEVLYALRLGLRRGYGFW